MPTLEVRSLLPQGPAVLGDLITQGQCVVDRDPIAYVIAHADLDPFPLPDETLLVALYIDGKYAGRATLTPEGLRSEVDGIPSPFFVITETLHPC